MRRSTRFDIFSVDLSIDGGATVVGTAVGTSSVFVGVAIGATVVGNDVGTSVVFIGSATAFGNAVGTPGVFVGVAVWAKVIGTVVELLFKLQSLALTSERRSSALLSEALLYSLALPSKQGLSAMLSKPVESVDVSVGATVVA